jgi:peptidoglycan/xylan/chitin deacetylase (PgdA/CDA1 family)
VGAQRAKRLLKHGVYRTIGETAALVAPRNGAGDDRLRVLMYHKVNDVPANPVTVPTSLFAEQMAQLRELGYAVVGLDAVVAHYRDGAQLPRRPVLITFDDGYRDNLTHAAPVLERHGYPAVVFVPIGFLDGDRPLPHEEQLAARGVVNATVDWGSLSELEAAGLRVESHGISHRALSTLPLDEAAREIVLSKLRLEERLGRTVEAFAYVKGSAAHFDALHVSLLRQAGYSLGFTSISGSNALDTDPLRLRRYNVEPYARRTFSLVLAGACDAIRVKDTVAGAHAKRLLNAALRTTSR